METPISEQDIEYAETYLAAGDISTASQMLERYLELAEEYIAEECQATDEVQYFSFQDSFERLCYVRVEHDPRRIVAVPAPVSYTHLDVYKRQVAIHGANVQYLRGIYDVLDCVDIGYLTLDESHRSHCSSWLEFVCHVRLCMQLIAT